MIHVESAFRPAVTSSKKAKGLLQVTDIAVKEINQTVERMKRSNKLEQFTTRCSNLSVDKLYEIEHNIRAGSCYFELMRIRHGGYIQALVAYNGGQRQLIRLTKGKRLVTETANYVVRTIYLRRTLCLKD
jgi:soluble lytic murein transglycosylase-like protein